MIIDTLINKWKKAVSIEVVLLAIISSIIGIVVLYSLPGIIYVAHSIVVLELLLLVAAFFQFYMYPNSFNIKLYKTSDSLEITKGSITFFTAVALLLSVINSFYVLAGLILVKYIFSLLFLKKYE